MSGKDEFLSRWSRRKQEARRSDDAPEEAEERALAPEDEPAAAEDERDEAEVLAELGLKDPDEMAKGDDFSAFMKAAVPAKLRNRALRRLWRTNPVLANLDDLVDYGEDFTDAGTVVGKLATAYRVGKGYLDDLPAKEAEKATPAPVDEAGETGAPKSLGKDTGEEPAEEPTDISDGGHADGDNAEEDIADAGRATEARRDAVPERRRQRMKFRY